MGRGPGGVHSPAGKARTCTSTDAGTMQWPMLAVMLLAKGEDRWSARLARGPCTAGGKIGCAGSLWATARGWLACAACWRKRKQTGAALCAPQRGVYRVSGF